MDDDAVRFLKIFTFLSLEEIEEIGKEFDQARHQRLAQKVLAREVVTLVHGKEAYEQAVHITEQLFAGNLKALSARDLKVALNGVPTYEISADENLNIVELLVNAKFHHLNVKHVKMSKTALSTSTVNVYKTWITLSQTQIKLIMKLLLSVVVRRKTLS